MSTTGLTRVGISAASSSHSRSAAHKNQRGCSRVALSGHCTCGVWPGLASVHRPGLLTPRRRCLPLPALLPMSRVSRWSMSCMPASWDVV